MTNGTLTSFLDQNNETLGLRDRVFLLHGIAADLNYLFSLTEDRHMDLNPIVHGDLSGANVLINGERKAYLADFGLSGTFKKLIGMTYLAKMTGHPGAVKWVAPELLSGENQLLWPPLKAACTPLVASCFKSHTKWLLRGKYIPVQMKCRIRRKKCDEQPNADGSCQTCLRLRLLVLAQSVQNGCMQEDIDHRAKIKEFLAAQGIIKGLPVMQDIDSPLDVWDHDARVIDQECTCKSSCEKQIQRVMINRDENKKYIGSETLAYTQTSETLGVGEMIREMRTQSTKDNVEGCIRVITSFRMLLNEATREAIRTLLVSIEYGRKELASCNW
ncbi:kinase-like domain-containing protein [Suillus subalutaceus]|uniref:kinase-like domain-containing protein n=1 Tax=Suillus subalutaceus TaxID=48586 RepID=UPI001B8870C3|nr:kinase-like domain-containing protein [Suillus subalutaceus]KAG1863261.1 kinase-like domain-containing protein [Suillus subalutaceus]